MSKLFLGFSLLVCIACSLANAADTDSGITATLPLNSDNERSRIQAERALAEAAYEREEAVCYERFAVADCIRQVRRHRREILDRLRQQEAVINASERKRKALEQLERIKEKSSDERLAEAAAKRAEARSTQQAREDSALEKANASGVLKQVPPVESTTNQPSNQGLTAGEIVKNRQQYQDKLKEAEENRKNRLKNNSEKTGSPQKPLPEYP